MEKLLTEIIQKLQVQKQSVRKDPYYVLMKEIWSELFQQMEIELELMVEDGKLDKRNSINYFMYKLK